MITLCLQGLPNGGQLSNRGKRIQANVKISFFHFYRIAWRLCDDHPAIWVRKISQTVFLLKNCLSNIDILLERLHDQGANDTARLLVPLRWPTSDASLDCT
jgi:hypothetical protein